MSSTILTQKQAEAIATTARSWLDTPYAHLGRLKGHACDCVGLVIMVAQELGITEFNTIDYGRDPHPERMRALLLAHLDELELDLDNARKGIHPANLMAGDIVHIRWRNHPRHLGIVLPREGGGFNMIHAFSGAGRVVEHNLDKVWLSIIRSGYRYRWPQ
jgi:cell wall-associated NlpC family hydrolase